MKATFAVLALFTAATLSAQTSPTPAPPTNLSVSGSAIGSGVSVCAADTDAENLCSWDSARGTHGRKCTLDVEKIRRDHPCDFTKATVPDMTDHKPMCISIKDAEHIAFTSSRSRHFRVRRFVPITATGDHGQACPKDPFKTVFDEKNVSFGTAFDTLEPNAQAGGCKYKLEVQFSTIDPHGPAEPNDPHRRHYECRDPHLLLSSGDAGQS